MSLKTVFVKGQFVRALSVVISVSMMSSLFTGCFNKKAEVANTSMKGEVVFPLKEPVTLSYWCEMPANAVSIMSNLDQTAWYKEFEKQTGVKINFKHPVSGQAREQLNVMIASNDLPDMIESSLESYSGGIIRAFSEGIVIDIKELQKKYAPNLTKLYQTYPELQVEVKSEDDNVLRVPFIRGHEKLRTFRGPAVRRDWLKELDMKEPATIDDWHTMLTAFKDKKGAKVPLLIDTNNLRAPYGLITAYGVVNTFFVENGNVVFGPMDPRYKDFMAAMKKWYDEGLIYSEFALGNNAKAFDALVTNGEVGSMYTLAGGGIGNYMNLMKDKDPKFDLVGIPYPSLKEGEQPKFMHRDPIVYNSASVSITSACRNPEVAMAWLDFGYGKQGNMIMNFGVEGESYTMENGYPKFTDVVTHNPDGLPMSTIGHKYAKAFHGGPFVQDERYMEQFFNLPQQQESINAWIKNSAEVDKANTLLRGQLTPEEAAKVTPKQVEIDTYVDEMFLKFVMGKESLDKFDEYVARLKKIGIEEIIAVRKAAHDRFIAKFPEARTSKSINVSEYYRK